MSRRRAVGLVLLAVVAMGWQSAAGQTPTNRILTAGTIDGHETIPYPDGTLFVRLTLTGTVSLPQRLWVGSWSIEGQGSYDPESATGYIDPFTVDAGGVDARRLTGSCAGTGGSAGSPGGGYSNSTTGPRMKLVCNLHVGNAPFDRVVVFFNIENIGLDGCSCPQRRVRGFYSGNLRLPASDL